MTDRAVSVTVNYVVTLTISTLLLSMLFVSAGGLIESQTEQAIESELEVLGQQLAADIESADRMATTAHGESAEVEIETRLPERVAGTGYTIIVDGDSERIELRTTSPAVSVTVRFATTSSVSADETISGGTVLIHWVGETEGDLEVERA